jgi:nucleotide-binding universal stress UspA family protein
MFERILVAYDGSIGGGEAVRKGASLAALCDAELTVLTVYRHHSLLEASFSMQRPGDAGNMDEIMKAYAREVAEAGRAMATEAGAAKVRLFVKSGQPARSIVAFARDHGSDLIVVGSRGLGSVEGFLVGSVSHKVTGLAECPVLVV